MNEHEHTHEHPHESEQRQEGILNENGLIFKRWLSVEGQNPLEWSRENGAPIPWDSYHVEIKDDKGQILKQADGVEFPTFFSENARNISWNQYFRTDSERGSQETSLKQVIHRIAHAISNWGLEGKYFRTLTDAFIFRDELKAIMVNQLALFNSPVEYNVGIYPKPQTSACFIQSVEDSIEGIMNLAKQEALLFRLGSGTGTNFSTLRSSLEALSGGGQASGPVSFMKGLDSFAGVIKSGGKTRRAAKMAILNADHPDIEEFIWCKAKVEDDYRALTSPEGSRDPNKMWSDPEGAYAQLPFQNANHSVRVTDEFMSLAISPVLDYNWDLLSVQDKKPLSTVSARDLLEQISQAAWHCGDPALQFDTTINEKHKCPNSGRIDASNPCSEFMYLNETACNLASVRFDQFINPDDTRTIDYGKFEYVCKVMITAQEIMVGNSSYPTPQIEANSHKHRPLGLGPCSVGAMLMKFGLPYDSEEGRLLAATMQAIMSAVACCQSAMMAKAVGPFEAYKVNETPFLHAIDMHLEAAKQLVQNASDHPVIGIDLPMRAAALWVDACTLTSMHGSRNSQYTVAAPTGTIRFWMDAPTTGIEPQISLKYTKHLSHAAIIDMVDPCIPAALRSLGYSEGDILLALKFLAEHRTFSGYLSEEECRVFDCALEDSVGRCLCPAAHVKMMAAMQPFICGAISKTVNLPESATPENIFELYMMAWQMGLKSIAVYRDKSKGAQPLNMPHTEVTEVTTTVHRKKLPPTRPSVTHKFVIGEHKGYITVGMYPDTLMPGEVFIAISKEGGVISGLMDAFATAISLNLQYGVPLNHLVRKFKHMRFEPGGFTENPAIPVVGSLVDYIFRFLEQRFLLQPVESEENDAVTEQNTAILKPNNKSYAQPILRSGIRLDKVCPACGGLSIEGCACTNCGSTVGGCS